MIELSEKADSFVKICLLLKIENVVSFIKPQFYWKQGCVKTPKHAETFYADEGYESAIVVFIPTWP